MSNYPPGVSDNDPYFDMPSVGDEEDEEEIHYARDRERFDFETMKKMLGEERAMELEKIYQGDENQNSSRVSTESERQLTGLVGFTPGPWRWKHTELWGTHSVESDGVTLTMKKCILFATFAAHKHVNTVNAHLIAAAPALYEACKRALETPGMIRGREVIEAALALANGQDTSTAKREQP